MTHLDCIRTHKQLEAAICDRLQPAEEAEWRLGIRLVHVNVHGGIGNVLVDKEGSFAITGEDYHAFLREGPESLPTELRPHRWEARLLLVDPIAWSCAEPSLSLAEAPDAQLGPLPPIVQGAELQLQTWSREMFGVSFLSVLGSTAGVLRDWWNFLHPKTYGRNR